MPLPDNRLQFPPTKIDFVDDVGVTGQSHEDFPGPGQQPRFDWLLMWFLSLFANQSSYEEPTEARIGGDWMDLDSNTRKVYNGTSWVALANFIQVDATDPTATPITLTEWVQTTNAALAAASPESTFSGSSSADGITSIPIPESLLSSIDANKNKAFLYINGLLIDPRNCELCPPTIELKNGIEIDKDDTFTVVIKNIPDNLFHVGSVIL